MFNVKSYKVGHPNPSIFREDYTILNGEWDFCFDYKNIGEKEKYYSSFPSSLKINVPYSYLSKNSGINNQKRCDNVWYHKEIEISDLDKTYLLHLEGADFNTILYVNSKYVGFDFGGYHRITFDITEYLIKGKNDIVIKCEDDMRVDKPRGKQRFLPKNFACWYEETTGIYKDVWIERVEKDRILDFKFNPNYDSKSVYISGETSSKGEVDVLVSYKDKVVYNEKISSDEKFKVNVDLKKEFHAWDVLKPELYDVKLSFKNDTVLSYFGVRKISVSERKILLNNNELYQKLILDQGYIEDGDLTLTSKELEKDIISTISLGFNGARKHQKRESDIYYSLADFYGLLVWSEMPSMYVLDRRSMKYFEIEWKRIVEELYNHPSIICYTPFNESWGVFGIDHKCSKAVKFINKIYNWTKEYDPSRLCQTNDGWSHLNSDIITIHNYSQTKEGLEKVIDKAIKENFVPFSIGRKLSYVDYSNKPIMVSEFGGFSKFSDNNKSWGYGENMDDEMYQNSLNDLFSSLLDNKRLCGYCYTQLTDVRQEKNGLLTMDRKFKIDPDKMKEIQRS